MTPEEAAGPDIEIHPDNMPAITLLQALRGQWLLRPDGLPHALNLASITPLVLYACGITRQAWREHVFWDLREAASAAIEVIHEQARSNALNR